MTGSQSFYKLPTNLFEQPSKVVKQPFRRCTMSDPVYVSKMDLLAYLVNIHELNAVVITCPNPDNLFLYFPLRTLVVMNNVEQVLFLINVTNINYYLADGLRVAKMRKMKYNFPEVNKTQNIIYVHQHGVNLPFKTIPNSFYLKSLCLTSQFTVERTFFSNGVQSDESTRKRRIETAKKVQIEMASILKKVNDIPIRVGSKLLPKVQIPEVKEHIWNSNITIRVGEKRSPFV